MAYFHRATDERTDGEEGSVVDPIHLAPCEQQQRRCDGAKERRRCQSSAPSAALQREVTHFRLREVEVAGLAEVTAKMRHIPCSASIVGGRRTATGRWLAQRRMLQQCQRPHRSRLRIHSTALQGMENL